MGKHFVRKTLGNNDLNQVVASSGFSENKGLGGGSVSQAHKTWSQSFLFKDFHFVLGTLCYQHYEPTPPARAGIQSNI